jgi:hypothetical protein
MSECIPADRDQLRAVGEHLAALPSIEALDLVVDDATHGVVLEATVDPDHAGLPPRAARHVAAARATVADVSPQGSLGHHRALVVIDR